MLKNDIVDLINSFEKETWKYSENEELYNDMEYIYSIEESLKNVDESSIKPIYDKLISLIGMIRLKYGFESIIINTNPEFKNLKNIVDGISLNSDDVIAKYNYVSSIYNSYLINIKNMNFIDNKYENIQGKEGLYLAVESLKSLITNDEYRKLLTDNQISEIVIDCIKLNKGISKIENLEKKYKQLIEKIWSNSLSDKIDENGKFRVLFSNISGGDLREQANRLVNRANQHSCSMISSNFIATYGSDTRKIGFIYPSDSEIICASAYDLSSNVFGTGFRNKEMGTTLATPEILEKIGKKITQEKDEDIYSSSYYNEILVNAKPCGILVLGLGEGDLNIDYYDTKMLALEMKLPIYYVDTMKYKEELSASDRNYIAFHSVLSYLGITSEELEKKFLNNDYTDILEIIDKYKEQSVDIFLKLKKEGTLSKDTMNEAMSNIIDVNYKQF